MRSIGSFDPSLNGIFGELPFPGHRSGAARCKPVMKRRYRCQRVCFSGLNCQRYVCGGKLCDQAADQMSRLVSIADGSCA